MHRCPVHEEKCLGGSCLTDHQGGGNKKRAKCCNIMCGMPKKPGGYRIRHLEVLGEKYTKEPKSNTINPISLGHIWVISEPQLLKPFRYVTPRWLNLHSTSPGVVDLQRGADDPGVAIASRACQHSHWEDPIVNLGLLWTPAKKNENTNGITPRVCPNYTHYITNASLTVLKHS